MSNELCSVSRDFLFLRLYMQEYVVVYIYQIYIYIFYPQVFYTCPVYFVYFHIQHVILIHFY